jgi:putative membrane protein
MFLSATEAEAIDARVAGVESRTGVQVVTALVAKSDAYVELPWKAFALGASLAEVGVVAADYARPDWVTASTALVHAVTILAAAAAAALAAVFVPAFGRLFLRQTRRDVEVRQYAESLFLRRELFATHARTAVLVFVSLFERRIEILADTGFRGRIDEPVWHAVVARMTPRLEQARPHDALQEGLSALESLLVERGFLSAEGGSNELPDRPIEEAGA